MNFTVYKSSAGSGKTYTLVKEYLKLCLQGEPDNFRHILAITFTNKAAGEMKDRVLLALKSLSTQKTGDGSVKFLTEDLIRETGLKEDEIREKAGIILSLILHNYSELAISTIDKFVHRIVRVFAHDLNIPLNFEVELEDEELLGKAIDLLINKAGHNEWLTRALVEYTESRAENEKSWQIDKDLLQFASALLKEDGHVHLERIRELTLDDFFSIKSILDEHIKNFEDKITGNGKKGLALINDNNIPGSSLAYGERALPSWFLKLADCEPEKISPNATVQKIISSGKLYSSKATESDKESIERIQDDILILYNETVSLIDSGLNKYTWYVILREHLYGLAVLNELEKILIELKEENNLVHISEFNKRIANIVNNEPVPFIYERMGERYRHYLIDEFQDTSVMQWQNLLPLLDNALGMGHFNMIVGDGKQSIYRWRGGEVEQFVSLPEVYKKEDNPILHEREQSLQRNYIEKQLKSNFRSKKEIVEFNNEFFSSIVLNLHPDYQKIYKDLEQKFDPENSGGGISIELIDGNETMDFREAMLERVKTLIHELLQENFSPGDIAILCRKKAEASEIGKYLTDNNISVISPDSLLLKNSVDIRFIIAVLNLINGIHITLSRAEILQYLLKTRRIEGDNLHLLLTSAVHSNQNFYEILNRANIEFGEKRLIKLPVYECCEEIIRIFKLDLSASAYIQFFLDTVLEYVSRFNNNIVDFLEWWKTQENKRSVLAPESAGSVQIMTIHKSKGLEFPVVIYPFAIDDARITSDLAWVDLGDPDFPKLGSALVKISKKLELTRYCEIYNVEKNKSLLDLVNTLYVAFTRPKERLYVLSREPSKNRTHATSVPDLLSVFYETSEQYKPGKSVFRFGSFAPKQVEKISDHDPEIPQRFISTNWRKRLLISRQSKDVWSGNSTTEKDLAMLAKYALTRLTSVSSLSRVLNTLLYDGLITNKDQLRLREYLLKILENRDIATWFEENDKQEYCNELLFPGSESYRPDRIIRRNDKYSIMDFLIETPEKAHIQPLQNYAELMEKAGFVIESTLLLMIPEARMISI